MNSAMRGRLALGMSHRLEDLAAIATQMLHSMKNNGVADRARAARTEESKDAGVSVVLRTRTPRGRSYPKVRSALARSASVLVVEPDDRKADPGPDPKQRHEHEERQEARRYALPHPPIRRPRGRENEDAVAHQGDGARADQYPGCGGEAGQVHGQALAGGVSHRERTTSATIAQTPKIAKPSPHPPATSDQ